MSTTAAQDEVDALFAGRDTHHHTHPEDAAHSTDSSDPPSDDEAVNAHFSDEDRDPSTTDHSNNMPSSVYHIPNSTTFDANTGPKGVIADAKSFDQARKRGFRQTLYALSESVFDRYKSPSPPAIATTESNSSQDSSDDDDFMREWRVKRMNELQSGNGQERRTRRQSPSKRRYGHMATVDAIGYLDAVEKVAADTMVVVCIYDEGVSRFPIYHCTFSLTTSIVDSQSVSRRRSL